MNGKRITAFERGMHVKRPLLLRKWESDLHKRDWGTKLFLLLKMMRYPVSIYGAACFGIGMTVFTKAFLRDANGKEAVLL